MSAGEPAAVTRVLRCLPGARATRDGEWRARCPVHDGTSDTSLKVAVGDDGRALLTCFAGCSLEAVLDRLGLAPADLFADAAPPAPFRVGRTGQALAGPSQAKRVVATYDYRNEGGDLRFQAVRYEPKGFAQRRPNGRGGWVWNLTGVELLLYRLPELLASDPLTWVVVAEGEKDADALATLGVVATTNPMGAGKWRKVYGEWLRGRRVAILPDNDGPGHDHAAQVARLLAGVAAEVRVVALPGLSPKGDPSDWVVAGGTAEALMALVAAVPAWDPDAGEGIDRRPELPRAEPTPVLRFQTAREFAAQTPAATEWVVEPFVPCGGTTKIDGAPKRAGKTTLIARMVAAVLAGADFLGKPTRRGPVVMLTEQGGTSFREALAAAGLLEADDLHLAVYRDIAALEWAVVVTETFALVDRVGAVLVVVDTFPQVAKVRGDDENSAGRALEAIEPLQVAADAHNVGVVVSFHDRKGGGEVGESGRGSSAFAGAVDVILHVSRPGGRHRATVRRIAALSRFEATPSELYVELTPTGYVAIGDEEAVAASQLGSALRDVLPTTEEGAIPLAPVKQGDEVVEAGILEALKAAELRVARSTVEAELLRWREAGYAGRRGGGKRGDPFRWWLVETPPEAFLRPGGPTDPAGAGEQVYDPSEWDDEPVGDSVLTEPEVGDEAALLSSDAHPTGISSGRKQCGGGDGPTSRTHPFLSSDAQPLGTSIGRKLSGGGTPIQGTTEKLSSDPEPEDLPVGRTQSETQAEGDAPDEEREVWEL